MAPLKDALRRLFQSTPDYLNRENSITPFRGAMR